MRKAVELKKAYRLLNHGPTVLVTSAAGADRNLMAAAWNMPLDFDPPKVCVVIDRNTFTRGLIEKSGEFALCVPTRDQAVMVAGVGDCSGRDSDKFLRFGIATFEAQKISAPLVESCAAWLECRVIPEVHNQTKYDLFVAEVLAAQADTEVFSDGRWHFEAGRAASIHHISGGAFFETGEAFAARE